MPGDRASRLVPLGNGYLYNPTRQLKSGAQGHRGINPETGTTYSPKGSINLYNLKRANMSFARTGFGRLLTRLRLEYKHEGDHHNLYRPNPPTFWWEGEGPGEKPVTGRQPRLLQKLNPPTLLYSATDTSKLVDFVCGEYVPELLRTGTVPGPTLEMQEAEARREARKEAKRRGISRHTGYKKMTKAQAVAKARSWRW